MPSPALLRRLVASALVLLLAGCDSPSGANPQPEPQPQPQPQQPVSAQAQWLAQHAIPLRTVVLTDLDFSDLQPLKAAIGDARVVMLGEQSHGDGTTFLAKARLVAFLHREMGFDVLAWESGVWDVAQLWRQVQGGRDVLQASRTGIFGIWTGSEQVLPTLSYVTNTLTTDRPLEMAGFDNQLTGTLARDSLQILTDQFARRIGSRVLQDPAWPDALVTLQNLVERTTGPSTPTTGRRQALLRLLADLRTDALARGAGDREAVFWAQVLESLASYVPIVWPAGGNANNLRDTQMARNLVWLANTWYPDRKIIVWAASSHIARDVGHLRMVNGSQPYQTGWSVHMGAEAFNVLGTQMYAIGFTAAAGQFGPYWSQPQTIPQPLAGSLEAHFVASGLKNAFIDFRALPAGGEWLRDVYSRPFGYGEMRGDWTRVLDAMVFTHDMVPSTPATN